MNDSTRQLFTAARDARANAHAPYSNFRVGAALAAGGKIYRGCNVENAAYPEGLCAEAAAIAAMVGDGVRRIDQVMIVAEGAERGSGRVDWVLPCGGCLQKIAEFASADTPLTLATPAGKFNHGTLRDYLPRPFAL